jgi:hypothetical protein
LDRFVPHYYSLKTDGTKTGSVTTVKAPVTSIAWKSKPGMVKTKPVDTVVKAPHGSLVAACQAKLPAVWREVVPNVAEAVSGPFRLVVRNFRDKSYDIKVMLDGVIVDTWVARHLDVDTVLDHLRSKVKDMRDSLGSLLG